MKTTLVVMISLVALMVAACGEDGISLPSVSEADPTPATQQAAPVTPASTSVPAPAPAPAPAPQTQPTPASQAQPTPAPPAVPSATPSTVAAVEPATDEFLAFALSSLIGAKVLEAGMGDEGVSISYEQATDATEADLLSRWINMALVAMTFMDAPRAVTILPMTEGTQVARIVVPAGILGEVLNGERSLQQAVAAIEVWER